MAEREADCSATPCAVWGGYIAPDGYGRKMVRRDNGSRSPMTAHRWAWIEEHGPLPPSTDVMHLCHNRACVRLDHLRPGSRSENLQMAGVLGRLNNPSPGESNGSAKLTRYAVDWIRSLYATGDYPQVRLAEMFSMSQSMISNITTERNWR